MPASKLWYRAVFTSLFVCLSVVSIARAQSARQIAQNTFPSVVLLVMEDANGQPVSLGSGFFVLDDVIATNRHVITGAVRGYAKLVGQKTKYDVAGIVGIDPARDLALLALRGVSAPSLPLGDSGQVAVGDEVYAIGNPQGLEGTFSQGIVSSIRKIGSDTLLQITAPISPGSSGGPVLNAQGEVIGVAVAAFKVGQNLNFAIPASYLTSLLANRKPIRRVSEYSTTTGLQAKSILEDLGGRSTQGVVGTQFTWKATDLLFDYGHFSFSLRNKLREPVKEVRYIVLFYDRHGRPIDYSEGTFQGEIPPGLATRVTHEHFLIASPVHESVRRLTARVEIRVLDFRIVE